MKARAGLLTILFACAASTEPLAAQARIGIRLYAVIGDLRLDAARTFDAVAGSNHTPALGIGMQLTNVWKELFLDAGASQSTITGERVFIDNGTIVPLGIPLQVRLRPFDVAAGWRPRYGRTSLYVGAGFSRLGYREISESAALDEDVAMHETGTLFLGGVDVALGRWFQIGADCRYRHVGGILGEAGTSAWFREGSAGGFSTSARVSVGR